MQLCNPADRQQTEQRPASPHASCQQAAVSNHSPRYRPMAPWRNRTYQSVFHMAPRHHSLTKPILMWRCRCFELSARGVSASAAGENTIFTSTGQEFQQRGRASGGGQVLGPYLEYNVHQQEEEEEEENLTLTLPGLRVANLDDATVGMTGDWGGDNGLRKAKRPLLLGSA